MHTTRKDHIKEDAVQVVNHFHLYQTHFGHNVCCKIYAWHNISVHIKSQEKL